MNMRKVLVGLTVLALLAMAAGPALADAVINVNEKTKVTNDVYVGAFTGWNTADGGSGGDGGEGGVGGKINIRNDGNDGGSGGAGGDGGSVSTGNAYAKAKVTNIVNTNYTSIDNGSFVLNKNKKTRVDNDVVVMADTGLNLVDGGSGGEGGEGGVGGKVNIDNDNNDGGSGGAGGSGGSVSTGNAYAKAKVFQLVNTNITRFK